MWNSISLQLVLILYLKMVAGDEDLSPFLEDIINEWNFHSPTILTQKELPNLCMSHSWLLCLPNNLDLNELTEHLIMSHKRAKQDAVIFLGDQHNLIKQLHTNAPAMFRSNYPAFMPLQYSILISLRLDSNIIFFEQQSPVYKLVDMFSVKGGPPITSELGTWDKIRGIKLKQKTHRWNRRTDLNGAEIINNLNFGTGFGTWSRLIWDDKGKVVGSQGELQNLLFFMAETLNATIKTTELPSLGAWRELQNGSWTGGIGILQRKEADINR